MRKLIFSIPLMGLLVLAGVFLRSLYAPKEPFASVLIDRPVPAFDLPAITQDNGSPLRPGLASDDLQGDVTLVNVFASWCVSCRVEHPLLMSLAEQDAIALMGLNWKDKPGDGAGWLNRFGNPYTRIGDDALGRTAIDFGVTGAPETFVIDHKSRVRYKHEGPITPYDWQETIEPLIQQLRKEAGAQ